ncbi:MAG: MerR family transcriptional regulator [Crocinitomicaceae bacterium]
MPLIDIQQLSKLYYSIGEVAELLNVNTSLLRFWEKEFKFEISKKNAKGNRLFSVKEIEKINRIYHFVKVEGYTLEGAKKALRSKNIPEIKAESSSDHTHLIQRLELIKRRLIQLKSTLPSPIQAEVQQPMVEQKPIPSIAPTPKKPAAPKSTPPSMDMPTLFD